MTSPPSPKARIESTIHLVQRAHALARLVGEAPVFRQVVDKLPTLARGEATILITGETGTGKELVARALHYLSNRMAHPFVPVNCGSLPETLLEDELFGHEPGAFTDARARRTGLVSQAEHGTLFLDEVGSLTARAQVVLLRVLQDKSWRPLGSSIERQIDVRFIAASNVPLGGLVHAGVFRADLFYRLCVLPVHLPPLRERRADIPVLVRDFLEKHALGERGAPRLSASAERALLFHGWPGNVRELENVIIRGVNLAEGNEITPGDLGIPVVSDIEESAQVHARSFSEMKRDAVSAFELDYLVHLMSVHCGNVSHAARSAGKERRDLGRLLKKHRLDPKSFAAGA